MALQIPAGRSTRPRFMKRADLALALPFGVALWTTWALSADGVEAGELSRWVRCFFPGCCAAVLAGVS